MVTFRVYIKPSQCADQGCEQLLSIDLFHTIDKDERLLNVEKFPTIWIFLMLNFPSIQAIKLIAFPKKLGLIFKIIFHATCYEPTFV